MLGAEGTGFVDAHMLRFEWSLAFVQVQILCLLTGVEFVGCLKDIYVLVIWFVDEHHRLIGQNYGS